mmetsp:Transcript_43157/g.70068  ORF Transcript_43157/g.70068 Transcript_43157/m.70068 type:complete len:376 (+) Transcript_43157:92-1219(+)
MASQSFTRKEGDVTVLDGSIKEGGGQVLRNSMCYAGLLKFPLMVINIRAGRPKPGLAAQHLTGIQLVRDLCSGNLQGGLIGSTQIVFRPGKTIGDQSNYRADPQTAGSISLLSQIALPILFFSPGPLTVELRGGTHVSTSPPLDFVAEVLRPTLERFGAHFDIETERKGFYPKGGGIVHLSTTPVHQLRPIDLTDRGKVVSIRCIAFVSGIPDHVAGRMASAAQTALKARLGKKVPIEQDIRIDPSTNRVGQGTAIICVAETSTGCLLAGSGLGERGVTAEKVGEGAANMLLANLDHGECVDEHLQDQVIIYMALANGRSRIRTGPLTLHTETSIAVAEALTQAKFQVSPVPGSEGAFLIECDGIGYTNHSLASS